MPLHILAWPGAPYYSYYITFYYPGPGEGSPLGLFSERELHTQARRAGGMGEQQKSAQVSSILIKQRPLLLLLSLLCILCSGRLAIKNCDTKGA